jgi:two-component system sensor histidine kinase KdpD
MLTTYLGIAPGVGKTSAMLAEGQRRARNGERVVIGWLERHGRPQTERQRGDLEIVAPRTVTYRGTTFAELDAAATIDTGADVVLVDELAGTIADSTRQRWQDVADIMAAGPDVLTTMNVAHLRSVRAYAAQVTGVGTVACVPDEFVRAGHGVLLDVPAEALRRRISSGGLYSGDQVGGALGNHFRAANLIALSELAQGWMAGTVDTVASRILASRGVGELTIVYESLIDDDRRTNTFGLLLSLAMLLVTHAGLGYTSADCRSWMSEVGFRDSYVQRLVGPDSMVVGLK